MKEQQFSLLRFKMRDKNNTPKRPTKNEMYQAK